MHFIQCTAGHLQTGYMKRREEFKIGNEKLRTAKVIYEGFVRIFSSLQCSNTPPSKVIYFESDLDELLQRDWVEQREIGWDQILKGRLSRSWGIAQVIFYKKCPETRGQMRFSSKIRAAATVRSLLDFSLNLWNDQCDTMHGVDKKGAKRIKKKKVMKMVGGAV